MTRQFVSVLILMMSVLFMPSAARAQNAAEIDSRFGVCTHFQHGWEGWNHEKILPMIAKAGIGWVRDDLYWGKIETVKGQYKIPEKQLLWIRAAHQHGLKLILVLNGGNKLYENPYDIEGYSAFAAEMARQLKDDVDCLEILNEPHNFGFTKHYGGTWNGMESNGQVSPWVGHYVTLLNKSAEAIKAANPKMKVVGLGSVAPVNFRQLAMGISPAVDGITDHPYSPRSVPELVPYAASDGILKRDGIATADERGSFSSQMQMYRALSDKHKGPREIWLTEWGFSTYQPVAPKLFAGYTESAQAKYIQRRMMECLGLGIEVSFLYDFKNDGRDRRDAEHNFGLVDMALKPKPSFFAVQRLIQIMRPWKASKWATVNAFAKADRPDTWPIVWDRSKIASPGTILTYQFSNDQGKHALAIWSSERADGDLSPRVADLEIETSATVSSIKQMNLMTGETTTIKAKKDAGAIMLEDMTVPDFPVLLIME